MAEVRLFFGRSFARELVPALGGEITDDELGKIVAERISTRSNQLITVVTTQDPLSGYIDEQVERAIRGCDYALFLFSGRVRDGLTGKWISSTYTISEAGGAKIALGRGDGTNRIFGLVEEGVDDTQLGFAFPSNKTAKKFRRNELDALLKEVDRIIDQIMQHRPIPKPDRECLLLSKTATVKRSGAVSFECRHRFRFKDVQKNITIPHTIFRVREEFPKDISLRCLAMFPERIRTERYDAPIIDRTTTDNGNEIKFKTNFEEIKLKPDEVIEYIISWSYPGAFLDHSQLNGYMNSVGLCTSGRGPAQLARLTLQFERNWTTPYRCIENPPDLSVNRAIWLPASEKHRLFWSHGEGWLKLGPMHPVDDLSDSTFEVYRWEYQDFEGLVKADWIPVMNYLDSRNDGDGSVRSSLNEKKSDLLD